MAPQVTHDFSGSAKVVFDAAAYMALAVDHYENFPVGSFLVPARLRPHIHRIYAFARTADDIADEQRDGPLLEAYRRSFVEHLRAGAAGAAGVGGAAGGGGPARPVPLFEDLAGTIRELELPEQLFSDLLDAFAQDIEVARYDDEAMLFDYCRRSADPVGRLVLRVFGVVDVELDALSDRICTGLQLLNHLQDIGEDLRVRDRIYFPLADLERFEVAEDDLRAERASPAVQALVRYWTDRTAALFRAGWPLTRAVPGRLALELRAILCGAAGVVAAIRSRDHDVLATHIRLGRAAKLRALMRALLVGRLPGAFR